MKQPKPLLPNDDTEPLHAIGIDLALFSGGVAGTALYLETTRIFNILKWPRFRKEIAKPYIYADHFHEVIAAHSGYIINPLMKKLQAIRVNPAATWIVLDWTPMEVVMRGRPTHAAQKAYLAGFYGAIFTVAGFPVLNISGKDVRKALSLKKATKEEVWKQWAETRMVDPAGKDKFMKFNQHEKDAVIIADLTLRRLKENDA